MSKKEVQTHHYRPVAYICAVLAAVSVVAGIKYEPAFFAVAVYFGLCGIQCAVYGRDETTLQ